MFGKKNKVHPHISRNYFSRKAIKEREKKDLRNIYIGLACVIIFLGMLA